MGLRFVVLVVLAGCGRCNFDASDSDALAGSDDVILPPNQDNDGDMVTNGLDNCQLIPNPDQHNEDGDAWGDACDGCPALRETTQVDADGDGVTDPCDPRPLMQGERIALFETFQTGLPATWQRTGTWVNVDDAIEITVTATTGGSVTLPVPADDTGMMAAGVRPLQVVGTQGDPRALGVSAYHAPGLASGRACLIFLRLGSTTPVAGIVEISDQSDISSNGYGWAVNNSYALLDQRISAGSLMCRALGAGTNNQAGLAPNQAVPAASVATLGISARVEWVMYVESP